MLLGESDEKFALDLIEGVNASGYQELQVTKIFKSDDAEKIISEIASKPVAVEAKGCFKA